MVPFHIHPIGVESATPGGPVMRKYWITKPFFETTDPQYVQQRIDNIMRMLSEEKSGPPAINRARKAGSRLAYEPLRAAPDRQLPHGCLPKNGGDEVFG